MEQQQPPLPPASVRSSVITTIHRDSSPSGPTACSHQWNLLPHQLSVNSPRLYPPLRPPPLLLPHFNLASSLPPPTRCPAQLLNPLTHPEIVLSAQKTGSPPLLEVNFAVIGLGREKQTGGMKRGVERGAERLG
eukprot:764658-Hanusia_phi.AAC.12